MFAVGVLLTGCRENAVAPAPVQMHSTSMADTLSKFGMVGDTLSNLRDVEPERPAPETRLDAGIQREVTPENREEASIR
jgi:hypothetical protein